MNIVSLSEAVKKGDRKLIGKIVVNGDTLLKMAYKGDFEGIVELIKKGPVDLNFKSHDGDTASDRASRGASRNAAKIIKLLGDIKTGKIKQLSEFVYEKKVSPNKALNKFQKKYKRMAVGIDIDTKKQLTDPLASNFGGFVSGLSHEKWPEADGKPIPFLCQFNLKEAADVPPILKDIALISIFSVESFSTIVIRAYKNFDSLVCFNPNRDKPCLTQYGPVVWSEPYPDYPSSDDDAIQEDDRDDELLESDAYNELLSFNTKMGGYPYPIQYCPFENEKSYQFCIQIAGESRVGLNIGDNGAIYIARGITPQTKDLWIHDWQCY